MYTVLKCGVHFSPPLIVVVYVENSSQKKRCRKLPVRNFKVNSNVERTAEEFKRSQRHKTLLKTIPQTQIERLLFVLQGHLKGNSIDESLETAKQKLSVDKDKDYNKADAKEIERVKMIMDEEYEKNRIKPEDPDFEYDIEEDFETGGNLEPSGWDSDDEF